MRDLCPMIFTLIAVIVSMFASAYAQDNPYRVEEGWAKYPEGRKWGSTSAVDVDRDGNVWVTDADGKDGKGHQVVKFSPDGKVLLALGKAGVAADSQDTFNRPSAVVTSSSGDIFVADGHGGDSDARIVKFSKDGKFIKAWGRKGAAQGRSLNFTLLRSMSQGGCWSATAASAASRSSTKKANFSRSGSSSAGRAESLLTETS